MAIWHFLTTKTTRIPQLTTKHNRCLHNKWIFLLSLSSIGTSKNHKKRTTSLLFCRFNKLLQFPVTNIATKKVNDRWGELCFKYIRNLKKHTFVVCRFSRDWDSVLRGARCGPFRGHTGNQKQDINLRIIWVSFHPRPSEFQSQARSWNPAAKRTQECSNWINPPFFFLAAQQPSRLGNIRIFDTQTVPSLFEKLVLFSHH